MIHDFDPKRRNTVTHTFAGFWGRMALFGFATSMLSLWIWDKTHGG